MNLILEMYDNDFHFFCTDKKIINEEYIFIASKTELTKVKKINPSKTRAMQQFVKNFLHRSWNTKNDE